MMKLMVINGPNLNFLGIREPAIYGKATYKDLCVLIKNYAKGKNIHISICQSNHEGDLIDYIQKAYYKKYDGIIINPGAYTHTSIALFDAITSINIPTIEVHLSDVDAREDFRKVSYVRNACKRTIKGKGFVGYLEAIDYFIQ